MQYKHIHYFPRVFCIKIPKIRSIPQNSTQSPNGLKNVGRLDQLLRSTHSATWKGKMTPMCSIMVKLLCVFKHQQPHNYLIIYMKIQTCTQRFHLLLATIAYGTYGRYQLPNGNKNGRACNLGIFTWGLQSPNDTAALLLGRKGRKLLGIRQSLTGHVQRCFQLFDNL